MTSVLSRKGVSRAERSARTSGDRELLVRYHDHGDLAARASAIERFMPLAQQLARRYQRHDEPLDDLVQVAYVGLVKAVDRFDPSRGTAFSTYAVPTIVGELKRHFRDTGWAVHLRRETQERALKLDSASQALRCRLGRSPSTTELAGEMGLALEEVLEAMEAKSAHYAASLDEPDSQDDASEPVYARALGVRDEGFDLVEYGAAIAPGIRKLSSREALILRLRFVDDLTQWEIADRLGMSQMHVSRLLRRSLAFLRDFSSGD